MHCPSTPESTTLAASHVAPEGLTPAVKQMITEYFDLSKNGRYLTTRSTADGLRAVQPRERTSASEVTPTGWGANGDLGAAVHIRATVLRGISDQKLDQFITGYLVLPTGARWREAASTALLSGWEAPLSETGFLPNSAFGTLKAEARLAHRNLTPVWRRRTRHGRVLSLDAVLAGDLSLYDLVAADIDLLEHTTGGFFEDVRLNAVLRQLDTVELGVVIALAEGMGETWVEAAAVAGVTDPVRFGEHVRRKAKRLAVEQQRRLAQRRYRSVHG